MLIGQMHQFHHFFCAEPYSRGVVQDFFSLNTAVLLVVCRRMRSLEEVLAAQLVNPEVDFVHLHLTIEGGVTNGIPGSNDTEQYVQSTHLQACSIIAAVLYHAVDILSCCKIGRAGAFRAGV